MQSFAQFDPQYPVSIAESLGAIGIHLPLRSEVSVVPTPPAPRYLAPTEACSECGDLFLFLRAGLCPCCFRGRFE